MNANDKLAEAIGAVIDSKLSNAMRGGKSSTKATVTGVDSEGKTWVRVAGADRDTPVRRSAVEASVGDMVSVTIGNGMAVIDANLTDPAASGKRVDDVSDKAKKANDLAAKTAVKANMISDVLYAHDGRFGHLESETAYIRDLKADNITTDNISATVGYIEDLTSKNITAQNIEADHAKVDSLDADYARIDTANIDTATIREAWVDALMVQTGLITHGATAYELDAIQVNASKIKTGTLDVERLIVTQNGQKYLIHVDTSGGTPVTTYEKLDGNVIEDLTITADKIVAGAITAQKITTENIVGSGGWINLRNGTFNYVNATTGEGIAWDGSHLTIKGTATFLGSVGGRNLVTGTTYMSVGSGRWSDGTFRYSGPSGGSLSNVTTTGLPGIGLAGAIRCTNTGTNTGQFGFAQDVCAGPRVGETFTQSAWVRASTTVKGYFLPLWNGSGEVPGNNNESNRFTFTTSWQRFTWTGTLNGTQVDAYSIGYVYANDLPQNAWFEVCGLQVERGNVATDWSPAPDDLRGIGGRNLVLGTGTAYSKAATAVSAGSYTAFDLYDLVSAYSSMGLKLGEKLTVSCDVTLTGAVADTTLKIGTNATPWEYFGVVATFAAGTSTQHIKATAAVTDSIRTCTGSKLRFRIDCPTAASALTVKAMNVKLERGDAATDWTPAHEDLPNDLASPTGTTVIDGGHITTNSIDASKIKTGSIAIGYLDSSTQGKINNGNSAYKQANMYTIDSQSTIVSNNGGWLRLGTLVSAGDSSNFTIHLFSGDGYNASATQNSTMEIVIKDGWQSSASATSAFGVSVTRENRRRNASADMKVKVIATAHNTCTVWVYFPWSYIAGHYSVEGNYNSWTDSQTAQTSEPSGTAQDVVYYDPSETATNYITADSSGIKVHNTGDLSNYTHITSNGMEVYKGGTSVASFGDSARVGKAAAAHSVIDANGQRFYASNGTTVLANIGYGSSAGESGTTTSPYYTFGSRVANSAIGSQSLAQGTQVTASGSYSLASGKVTTASGIASCAMNYYTTAAGKYQTVVGKYNEDDSSDAYAFIVGNGANQSKKSNAFAVGWDGNAVHRGSIYYQGTKAKNRLIRFIDNTDDAYGNGVAVGDGGLAVLGAGESAYNLISALSLSAGTEDAYVSADGKVCIVSNCNTIANRKVFTFGTDGALTLPSALSIANGGTGATSASAARTNLGLGTAATKNAVDIVKYVNASKTYKITSGGGNAAVEVSLSVPSGYSIRGVTRISAGADAANIYGWTWSGSTVTVSVHNINSSGWSSDKTMTVGVICTPTS